MLLSLSNEALLPRFQPEIAPGLSCFDGRWNPMPTRKEDGAAKDHTVAGSRGGGGRRAASDVESPILKLPKDGKACANPYNAPLEAKLVELRHTAVEKGKDRLAFTFGKALKSVRLCKEFIQTRRELEKLKHVGPFCSEQLKGALREARELAGLQVCGADADASQSSQEGLRPRKRRRARAFKPEAGEAAWIFLVALYKRHVGSSENSFNLSQIEDEAEVLQVEFDLRIGYFANAVERVAEELKARSLVDVSGREDRRRWSLTQEGTECAAQLWSEHTGTPASVAKLCLQSTSVAQDVQEDVVVHGKNAGTGKRRRQPKSQFCPEPGEAAWIFLVTLYKRRIEGRGEKCTLADLGQDAALFLVKFGLRRSNFSCAAGRVADELEKRSLVNAIGAEDDRLFLLTQEGNDCAALLWMRFTESEVPGMLAPDSFSGGLATCTSRGTSAARYTYLAEDAAGTELMCTEVSTSGAYSAAMTLSRDTPGYHGDAVTDACKSNAFSASHGLDDSKLPARGACSKVLPESTSRPSAPMPFGLLENISVILIQDHRETQKDNVQSHLLQRGVSCENRALHLGDMIWVAHDKRTKQEYVLDFIIERKSAPDLAQSIIDGRYADQKSRLRACGIHHVTYLVEGAIASQERLPKQTLRTAIAETRVLPGFRVLRTDNIAQSAEELRRMHEQIKSLMQAGGDDARALFVEDEETGGLVSLEDFQSEGRKQKAFSAGEIFARMLCQVPKFSHVISLGIVEHFPTLRCAIEHAEGLSEEDCVKVYKKVRGEKQSRGAPQKSLEVFAKLLTQMDYRV